MLDDIEFDDLMAILEAVALLDEVIAEEPDIPFPVEGT
jgi:hypothetical protein